MVKIKIKENKRNIEWEDEGDFFIGFIVNEEVIQNERTGNCYVAGYCTDKARAKGVKGVLDNLIENVKDEEFIKDEIKEWLNEN